MNPDSLPAGTRLHNGAVLIEEVLRREAKAVIYRAHDLRMRRDILLAEYFPENATRHEREVRAPVGWSTRGFQLAREKWAQDFPEMLFPFEENNTLYVAQKYSPQAAPEASTSSTPPVEIGCEVHGEQKQVLAPLPTRNRTRISWRDV